MDRYISYERLQVVADGRKVLIWILLCLLIVSIIVNIMSVVIKEASVSERVEIATRNAYPELIWERDSAILDYAALIEAIEHTCNEKTVKEIYRLESQIRQEGE